MSIKKVRAGDEGTKLEVVIKDQSGNTVDISNAAVKSIILRDTNGVETTHTAALSTDGHDGKMYYKTVSGDVPAGVVGTYQYWGKVTLSTGVFSTTVVEFEAA